MGTGNWSPKMASFPPIRAHLPIPTERAERYCVDVPLSQGRWQHVVFPSLRPAERREVALVAAWLNAALPANPRALVAVDDGAVDSQGMEALVDTLSRCMRELERQTAVHCSDRARLLSRVWTTAEEAFSSLLRIVRNVQRARDDAAASERTKVGRAREEAAVARADAEAHRARADAALAQVAAVRAHQLSMVEEAERLAALETEVRAVLDNRAEQQRALAVLSKTLAAREEEVDAARKAAADFERALLVSRHDGDMLREELDALLGSERNVSSRRRSSLRTSSTSSTAPAAAAVSLAADVASSSLAPAPAAPPALTSHPSRPQSLEGPMDQAREDKVAEGSDASHRRASLLGTVTGATPPSSGHREAGRGQAGDLSPSRNMGP